MTQHSETAFSRWRRRGLATTIAVAAAIAVTGAVGAGTAHADTLPNGGGVNLSAYSIPAKAPAYSRGGDMLPTIPGTLGNASELFVAQNGNTNQALTIQGGATAWGTPVVSAPSTDSKAQQWNFQLVGTVAIQIQALDPFSGHEVPDWVIVPVYRAISYNGGSPTCLDVDGGSGTAGSTVDAYGCNPNQVNQTNQLWTVESIWNGYDPSLNGTSSSAPTDNMIITSLASLAENNFSFPTAPVVSAGIDDIQGVNSSVQLSNSWQMDVYNSTYIMVDPNASSSSGSSPSGPDCSMFACLLGSNN
jgi:hypothetical protein